MKPRYFLHKDRHDSDHVYLYCERVQPTTPGIKTRWISVRRIADFHIDDIDDFYTKDIRIKIMADKSVYVTEPIGDEIEEGGK